MAVSSYDKVDNVRFEDMGEITLPKNAGSRNLYRMCKREEAPVKPVGLIHSSINYQIQTLIISIKKIITLTNLQKNLLSKDFPRMQTKELFQKKN